MRKFYSWITAFFFALAALPVAAQQGSLIADSLINFPDTVTQGNVYSFGVFVRNNGSTVFQAGNVIYILIAKDSGGFFGNTDTITSAQLNTQLGPNDTVTIPAVNYSFTDLALNPGHNIVVVWPKEAGGGSNSDSLFTSVFFQLQAAVVETKHEENISVHFNNLTGNLEIVADKGKTIEQVRIMDAGGRIAMVIPYNGNPVSLLKFSAGRYVAVLIKEHKIVAARSFTISR